MCVDRTPGSWRTFAISACRSRFDPPPRLAPYVRFFWVLEAKVEPGEEFVHRSLADGCVEIVFHYRTAFDEIAPDGSVEVSPFSNIQAQSTGHRRFAARENFGIFGTYLYPFAIPKLFGRSAAEFTNHSPDLRSAFGREVVWCMPAFAHKRMYVRNDKECICVDLAK